MGDKYVDQPTAMPTQKVAAAGISGAATIMLVYVLGLFGLEIPPEVAAALTALLAFAGGYLVKNKVGGV